MKTLAIAVVTIGLALAAAGESVRTNAAPRALFQRVYQTDTNIFFSSLRRSAGAKEDQSDLQVLRSYFKRKGVGVSPPFSLYYKPRTGQLLVRATEEDQKTIAAFLAQFDSRK